MAGRNTYTGHSWLSASTALAEIKKLQHDRRYREVRGVFFLEGVRNFVQAVDNAFDIVAIIHSERLLTVPLARKLVRRYRREGVPTLGVSPEIFRQVSNTPRASGVGAIVRQRWARLHNTLPGKGLCWVVLGQVRSAGNFGTLIRTSEAVGGAGFILLDKTTDPFSPLTVRASMGAIFRQQFIRSNDQSFSHWVGRHHGLVVGASPDGAIDLHQFAFPPAPLLFLGEERQGLTQQQRASCHHLVRIPMVGQADSLNLGVAGSLLLYEVYRSKHAIAGAKDTRGRS
ncbi:MAG: RNA methyltransferase [Anaerolineae bacterium]|nr:RNA methyltransferase [Anaerolineae bacterium]